MTQSSTQIVQLAGAALRYEVDVGRDSLEFWDDGISIAASGIIRPTDQNLTGFVYVNGATAGQTGNLEPAWPTVVGGTVVDGSLTWTAAAPPAAGQDTIQSATWTQISPPDAALTITGQSNTSLVASALIGGGTVGNVYTIQIDVTMKSGVILPYQIILTIL